MEPVLTYRRPIAAHFPTHMPRLGAVALFPVKQNTLRDIDNVRYNGRDNANYSYENPALGAIEPRSKTAADVLAVSKRFDAVCVCYAVVDPVGGGKLVVPHPIVVPKRALGGDHAVFCEPVLAP